MPLLEWARVEVYVPDLFPDEEVEEYRSQIRACLEEVGILASKVPREFHFSKIYNRASPWNELPDGTNLRLMEFFAFIYEQYHWPVVIQTIDDRTLQEHGIEKLIGRIDGLDLSNRSDLSLLWLLFKIKQRYRENQALTGSSLALAELRVLFHPRQRQLQQQNLLNPLIQRFDFAILVQTVGAIAGAGAGGY